MNISRANQPRYERGGGVCIGGGGDCCDRISNVLLYICASYSIKGENQQLSLLGELNPSKISCCTNSFTLIFTLFLYMFST